MARDVQALLRTLQYIAFMRDRVRPASELALFLKFLRRRADPNLRKLGSYVRLESRVGKRVTQEELAEAIGTSREWYAVLESTAMTRPSARLLERLCDVLMVTSQERERLFCLAVPELGRAEITAESPSSIEAFSRLKFYSNRLSASTSVQDILRMTSEYVAEWFTSPVLVRTSRRHEPGVWESHAIDDKQERSDASKVLRELEDEILSTPHERDGLNLYPQLQQAGEIGTPTLVPHEVQREFIRVFARRRLPGFTFINARVRSRSGIIAGFCIVHEFGHVYSDEDRAVLAALAELTSLALS
jgi:transcriptional regulator with XRE-family HTH domain